MSMTTPWVRLYTTNAFLDETFDLFKERASTLLLAGALPYVALVGFLLLLRTFVIPGNLMPELSWDAFWGLFRTWNTWAVFVCVLFVWGVFSSISYIAQCRIATLHALGEEVSLAGVFRSMSLVKPVFSMLVAGMAFAGMSSVLLGMGFFLLSVLLLPLVFTPLVGQLLHPLLFSAAMLILQALPGTLFLTTPTLIAVEHLGPFAALGRATRLAGTNLKASFWALFIVLMGPGSFIPVIVAAVMAILGVTKYMAPTFNWVLSLSLVMMLSAIIFFAILACFQAVAYIDGRCRAEAFDLLLLAKKIGLGNEVEEALRIKNLTPQAYMPAYPDYTASPTASLPAQPAENFYAAVNLETNGLTPPQPMQGYPDYSAPPAPLPEEAGDAR